MNLVRRTLLATGVLFATLPVQTEAFAEPPVLVASYTPEQRAALEYYRRHYPAYYAKYYAPIVDGRTAPTPPKPPRDAAAEEVKEEGDTGLSVAGLVGGETEMNGARTLGGHTFQYPRLFDTAFTATNFHVGSSVEVFHQGDVRTSITQLDGSDEELTYDRDLVFLRMDYGVAFAPHEAVTLGLDADYLIEVGANQQAIILYGGQTGYDFRPAAKLRLYRSDELGLQLALKGFGTFSGGIRAVPTGLLTHLGERDEEEEACLATDVGCAVADEDVGSAMAITRERKGGGGSLNFAKSVGRFLGAQLSVGLEGARASVTSPDTGPVTATGLVFTAGASPSLNFYPGWPIALTLEYRFEWHRNAYDANAEAGLPDGIVLTAKGHRFGGGIYYTGRRDLLLGWSAGASLLEDAERGPEEVGNQQPDALLFAAQFDMRYFF